ncbi:MAG: hypothetical protein IT447_02025 [Phycisphaerales bacterium]|jgi:DNA polymerase-3 subunit epsilon|nr:hypothetical protein [Phycisphaerales bacterium]
MKHMTVDGSIFDQCESLDAGAALEDLLRKLPARWVIYLMADEEDRPVQLLCVRNLRASIKRRLGEAEDAGPSRRIDYRRIVRRIYWRRVDSTFEADCLYLRAARELFPKSYQGMVGFRPAWFIHVEPEADFPRYVKTTELTKPCETIGPVEDKHAAARLIEEVEDLFDLCRYYNILVDAPGGKACAYKEMGRCPAPCDGSISMVQYRQLIAWSARVLVDPAESVREHQRRMNTAAAELRFELAGRIKSYADRMANLNKGPWRHLRRLRDFSFLSFQHGPKADQAKIFLITPGRVEQILSLIDSPERGGEILRVALTEAAAWRSLPIDTPAAERIAIVAKHLFETKSAQGVFIPLDRIDEPAILKGCRELRKRKINVESEDEGIIQ